MSVAAPRLVLIIIILAPINGSLVSASTTFPLILPTPVWARSGKVSINTVNTVLKIVTSFFISSPRSL